MIELRRLAPWLLAAFVAVAAGCTQPPDPASLVAKSNAYREKQDYPATIIELRNALQQNPNHPEARFLLGTAYLESGQAAFATVELQKALKLGYDPKVALPELAKSLIAQEKFKETLDATNPATVPSAQGSPEILNLRAFAQLGLRQINAAKASLDLAMLLRPDFADGMLSQARIASLLGDNAGANALVDKAAAVAPNNADAWQLKADLQRHAGDADAARASLQKALAINPRSASTLLALASLDIATQRYEDAAKQLETVRAIAPWNVMGLYLKALLELRTGNNKAALESVYRALEIAPKHVPSTLLGGIAELALGHRDQAEKYLNTALELDPRSVYARKLLAISQMQKQQYPQAIATLEPILDQKDVASDPAVLALAGEAYLQNKQFAKATQYFEAATSLDPQNASTLISLGISRMAVGESDRAVVDLEAASALGKSGARADVMLVMLNLRRKEFDQALKTLAKLQKDEPDNTLLYNLKAAAYMGKGDTVQARAQFERALKIDPAYFPAAANLAQLDLQAGNVAAARQRYESVLAKDKDQVRALLALADLSSRLHGPEKEVLELIQRAKAAAPGSSAPLRVEIDHYRRSGQLEKALSLALDQKSLRPNDPDTLALVGQLLMAMGRTADAVAAYRDRAVLLPNSAEAQLDLAGVQMAANDPAAAGATLQTALRLKPAFPEAQAMAVAAELAQGRSIRALQAARQVQHDLPQSPLGFMLEGDVAMASKNYAQALTLYSKAYGMRRSAPLAIKLHETLTASGKPDQADARLVEWLADHPEDVATRRYLAYNRVLRGKYTQGVEQYRLVLSRLPNDPDVLNNLAWAMSKDHDKGALEYARKAHELRPTDGAIADTLAQILIDRGNLPEGIEMLQKAVAAAPANREIRLHLAQALAKSGDKAKAISQLEIVIGSGPNFPQEADAIALMKQLR